MLGFVNAVEKVSGLNREGRESVITVARIKKEVWLFLKGEKDWLMISLLILQNI